MDTRASRATSFAVFDVVELFQYSHWNYNVVFFKGEKSVGFVKQNISIEDVNLSFGRIFLGILHSGK